MIIFCEGTDIYQETRMVGGADWRFFLRSMIIIAPVRLSLKYNQEIKIMNDLFSTTPIPNSYIDIFMPFLTDPEWKVLCYIVRLTQNNPKIQRQIKLSEFANGRVTKDGKRLDYGTGLAQNTCRQALKSLKKLGLIIECTNRHNWAKLYAPPLDPDKVNMTILQERLGVPLSSAIRN